MDILSVADSNNLPMLKEEDEDRVGLLSERI
jgi:hypothetical protein